jgi:hypothetical protein
MKKIYKVLVTTCIGLYAFDAAVFAMDPHVDGKAAAARVAPVPIGAVDDALRGAAQGMLTDEEIRAVCARPVSELTQAAEAVLADSSVRDNTRVVCAQAGLIRLEAGVYLLETLMTTTLRKVVELNREIRKSKKEVGRLVKQSGDKGHSVFRIGMMRSMIDQLRVFRRQERKVVQDIDFLIEEKREMIAAAMEIEEDARIILLRNRMMMEQ